MGAPAKKLPAKSRQMMSQERLAAAGGKRISVNLPADIVSKLDGIQQRLGCSLTEAVITAIDRTALRTDRAKP